MLLVMSDKIDESTAPKSMESVASIGENRIDPGQHSAYIELHADIAIIDNADRTSLDVVSRLFRFIDKLSNTYAKSSHRTQSCSFEFLFL